MKKRIIEANETAEKNCKPRKGVYLMTDIRGNQRRVKVSPAQKSIKIEMIDNAPKLRTDKSLSEFIYKKGSVRLVEGGESRVYCWDDMEFKVYPENGLDPFYFEFVEKS